VAGAALACTPALSIALRRFSGVSPRHAHAHLQAVWIFEGQVDVDLGGQKARMAPGHAVVIAPGEPHAFSAPGGACFFVVDSHDGTHAQRFAPIAGRLRASDGTVGHLLRYLAAQPALAPGAAEVLLASLESSTELATAGARRAVDWAALEAWIGERLAHPLTVASLAATVHLSPTQFAARCVDELGVTPMALVRRQRLAMARRLRESGVAVGLVAARCGYRSPSALTAALKRESPAD